MFFLFFLQTQIKNEEEVRYVFNYPIDYTFSDSSNIDIHTAVGDYQILQISPHLDVEYLKGANVYKADIVSNTPKNTNEKLHFIGQCFKENSLNKLKYAYWNYFYGEGDYNDYESYIKQENIISLYSFPLFDSYFKIEGENAKQNNENQNNVAGVTGEGQTVTILTAGADIADPAFKLDSSFAFNTYDERREKLEFYLTKYGDDKDYASIGTNLAKCIINGESKVKVGIVDCNIREENGKSKTSFPGTDIFNEITKNSNSKVVLLGITHESNERLSSIYDSYVDEISKYFSSTLFIAPSSNRHIAMSKNILTVASMPQQNENDRKLPQRFPDVVYDNENAAFSAAYVARDAAMINAYFHDKHFLNQDIILTGKSTKAILIASTDKVGFGRERVGYGKVNINNIINSGKNMALCNDIKIMKSQHVSAKLRSKVGGRNIRFVLTYNDNGKYLNGFDEKVNDIQMFIKVGEKIFAFDDDEDNYVFSTSRLIDVKLEGGESQTVEIHLYSSGIINSDGLSASVFAIGDLNENVIFNFSPSQENLFKCSEVKNGFCFCRESYGYDCSRKITQTIYLGENNIHFYKKRLLIGKFVSPDKSKFGFKASDGFHIFTFRNSVRSISKTHLWINNATNMNKNDVFYFGIYRMSDKYDMKLTITNLNSVDEEPSKMSNISVILVMFGGIICFLLLAAAIMACILCKKPNNSNNAKYYIDSLSESYSSDTSSTKTFSATFERAEPIGFSESPFVKYSNDVTGNAMLIAAASKDDVETIREYVEVRHFSNDRDDKGLKPMHYAAIAGKLDNLRYFIENCHEDVESREGVMNRTVLHLAVKSNSLPVVEYLVNECNANTRAIDNNGWTPLHYAASMNNSAIIEFLLMKNASVDAKSNSGWTPLHVAAFEGKYEAAVALVRIGHASCIIKNSLDKTPIEMAEFSHKIDVADFLIEECESNE